MLFNGVDERGSIQIVRFCSIARFFYSFWRYEMNSIIRGCQLGGVVFSILFLSFSGTAIVEAGGPWEHITKLDAEDGAHSDEFGRSVALWGNRAVIGAPDNDDNGTSSGSAYVFDISTGQQLFKLLAKDAELNDYFGTSVALSGNLTVVGANKGGGITTNTGAAYVFDVTTGEQLYKLFATDGKAHDNFGVSVSLSGHLAVIGSSNGDGKSASTGTSYVFDITTGELLVKLSAVDGNAYDVFGKSVAISGNTALIGAPFDGDNGRFSGSAYIFDVSTGQQLFKLQPADGALGDKFGSSVSLSGHLAVIGAPFDDDNDFSSGSVYVFDATTGQQLFKLHAADFLAYSIFGFSVSISNDLIVVGEYGDNDKGGFSGSAYVFDATTGEQLSKLVAADGDEDDWFGWSVANSGTQVVIGALFDRTSHHNATGSGYVYQPGCLNLAVTNLVAGKNAIINITDGLPGTRSVTFYGTRLGNTIVNDFIGYCANLGIKGLSRNKLVGGISRVFDMNGEISFSQFVPDNANGVHLFFQSAMQGTCPDECVSNLVDMVVQ